MIGHTAAAIYLLEHVLWATNNRGNYSSLQKDTEVFKRWVEEALSNLCLDLEKAVSIQCHQKRGRDDFDIVYGSKREARAKL